MAVLSPSYSLSRPILQVIKGFQWVYSVGTSHGWALLLFLLNAKTYTQLTLTAAVTARKGQGLHICSPDRAEAHLIVFL